MSTTLRITENYREQIRGAVADERLAEIIANAVHAHVTGTIPPALTEGDREKLREIGRVYIVKLMPDGALRSYELAEFVPHDAKEMRSFAFLRTSYGGDTGVCVAGGCVSLPVGVFNALKEVAAMKYPSVEGLLEKNFYCYEAAAVRRLCNAFEAFISTQP